MTASGGEWLGCGRIEQQRKRAHGHGQHSSDCWGKGDVRGLNGNGKNIIKIIHLKNLDLKI